MLHLPQNSLASAPLPFKHQPEQQLLMRARVSPTTPHARTVRPVRRNLSAAILAFCVLAPLSPGLFAQTNSIRTLGPEHRFLLILDTSRAMQRRADGVASAVEALLNSSMRGQIHRGDSLGIWTFNDDLYSGNFPLQEWSPEAQEAITGRVLKFLSSQKYSKQSRLDCVLPAMSRLLNSSDLMTVFLFTDGSAPIRGTPFDAQINQSYESWRAKQASARMPFITVLRSQQRKLAEFVVTAAPWPVELPPLPEPPKLAPTPKPVVAAVTNRPAARPLIITGKKTVPPAQKPAAAAVVSNSTPALAQTPPPSAPITATEQSQPTPPPASKETLSNAVASTSPPETKASDGVRPSSGAATPETFNAGASAKSAEQSVAAAPAATPAPPASQAATLAAQPVVRARTPATPEMSDAPANAQLPAQPAAAAPEGGRTPPVAAAISPQRPLWAYGTMVGILALAVAGSVVWFRRTRSRASAHASLITRSLDRER